MKKKHNKGFTLIELIIVIAILAILALIAIPRFAGFTDRAKIQADEQYAALIANATMVMAAAGDVGYTTGTNIVITIEPDGDISSVKGITFGGSGQYANDAAYIAAIPSLVAKSPLQYYTRGNGMQITADDSGSVKTVIAAP